MIQPGGQIAGQSPGTFDISIGGYQGNNSQDVSDFDIGTISTVGTFSTGGLAAGDILSFDVTSLYETALSNNFLALGFRLQAASDPGDDVAYTFGNFTLDAGPVAAPEPSTVALATSALPAGQNCG